MENKKSRTIAIFALVLAIAATSVAYAVLSTTLNVSGTVTKKGGSWNIHLENAVELAGAKVGDATITLPTITDEVTTQANFSVLLVKPSDSASFTIDVKNSGTVDASLTNLVLVGVSEAQAKHVTYTATYSDDSTITQGDTLTAGTKKTIKVVVTYDSSVTASELNSTDQTLNLGLRLDYQQAA